MRIAGSTPADDWRKRLPDYGQPPLPTPDITDKPRREPRRRRSHALGWFVALGIGAALTALLLSNRDDPRSLGTQLDDTVASVRNLGTQAGQTLTDSQNAAAEASRSAVDGVSTAIEDTAISAKVKTALAADPSLSAARIVVTTTRGVVRLEGPAPDAVAKDRATVLAGAPQGVSGVDNRLALPQPGAVVAVADGVPRTQPPVPAQALPAVPATPVPDAALTNQVKAALAADATLAKAGIDVTSHDGIVRLDGLVSDLVAKDRAARLAAIQPGVKSVDNHLGLLEPPQAVLAPRGPVEGTAR